jgi:hypothetical protein
MRPIVRDRCNTSLRATTVTAGSKTKKSGRNAHFSGGFEPPSDHRDFAYPDAITPIDPKSSTQEAITTPRARAN